MKVDSQAYAVLFAQHPPGSVIEALAPYVTVARQQRIADVVAKRLNSIQVALECPADPHNIAAVVRNCEAFGVVNLHLIKPEQPAPISPGVTQGAHHWIKIHRHDSLTTFLEQRQGLQLAGACMRGEDELTALPLATPLCLILGNEQRGLSQAAREACDFSYRIPMVGMSESLNLSVSTAISLYATTQRRRAQGDTDLTPAAAQRLTAEYYLKSVQPRLIAQLF
jgi:tRNA (guanosine-2'-O-)-methyltransferase